MRHQGMYIHGVKSLKVDRATLQIDEHNKKYYVKRIVIETEGDNFEITLFGIKSNEIKEVSDD